MVRVMMIPEKHLGVEFSSHLLHNKLLPHKSFSFLHISLALSMDTKKQFGEHFQANNTTLNTSLVYSTNTDS